MWGKVDYFIILRCWNLCNTKLKKECCNFWEIWKPKPMQRSCFCAGQLPKMFAEGREEFLVLRKDIFRIV